MTPISYITPTDDGGSGGAGGGGEDPTPIQVALRSQGLLTLAFGFALGLALLGLYFLANWWGPQQLASVLNSAGFNWWKIFLAGLIGGTIVSAIYNMLVVRRLNIFGLDAHLD